MLAATKVVCSVLLSPMFVSSLQLVWTAIWQEWREEGEGQRL